MRTLLTILLILGLCTPAFAVKITIDLTAEEKAAVEAAVGNIEAYVKRIANAQLNQALDREWDKKSLSEKKQLIP